MQCQVILLPASRVTCTSTLLPLTAKATLHAVLVAFAMLAGVYEPSSPVGWGVNPTALRSRGNGGVVPHPTQLPIGEPLFGLLH
jgi:hypothetical protein